MRPIPEPTRQALIYVAGTGGRLLAVGIVGILVARYMGPADLGLFSFALAVFAFLAPLAGLGMRPILVRQFSSDSEWRREMASAAVPQLAAAVVISVVATLAVAASRGFASDAVRLAVALSPIPLLTLADTPRVLLEVKGEAKRIVVAGFVAVGIASILRIAGIVTEQPVWFFGATASVEALVLLVGLMWRKFGVHLISSIRTHFSAARAKRLVTEGIPLLVGSVAVLGYMRVDIVMLGFMVGDESVGIYTAATRITEIWFFVPVAASAALKPRLSKLYASGDMAYYETLTRKFVTASAGFGVAVIAATVLLADPLVDFLYGEAFAGSAEILKLHVLAAPFVFIGVASSQWLIDHNLAKTVMIYSTAGLFLNVALNLLLIPAMGPRGAAISAIAAYATTGIFLNASYRATRPLFHLQLRSLKGPWT